MVFLQQEVDTLVDQTLHPTGRPDAGGTIFAEHTLQPRVMGY
ncbi:MAG: hypothetical protein WD060_07595 [Pirellulales bacterium]